MQPMIPNAPTDEQEQYEYVRNPETEQPENAYLDLEASSPQPDSLYQEVTNPDNLKKSDMNHPQNLKSSITESECQAPGPQDSEPTYDTAM